MRNYIYIHCDSYIGWLSLFMCLALSQVTPAIPPKLLRVSYFKSVLACMIENIATLLIK